MIEAKEFYEISVVKQREFIEKKIKENQEIGDPMIVLPFDVYPVVKKEMREAGWHYTSCVDKNSRIEYAVFCPEQYVEYCTLD